MATVLIVDDDKIARLLYTRELLDEGYQVTAATSAIEAIESFKHDRPDAVILDIRMPGMDGLEVLARLLAIDRKVPVLLNTAFAAYRDNFLCWAADDFLIKSSDLTELKCALKNRISNRSVLSSNLTTTKSWGCDPNVPAIQIAL